MSSDLNDYECRLGSDGATVCELKDERSTTKSAISGCVDVMGSVDGAQALSEFASTGQATFSTFASGSKCAIGAYRELNKPERIEYL